MLAVLMSGLMLLMSIALAVVLLTGAAGVVYALRHPPRRTFATQIARGLPTHPGEMDLLYQQQTVRTPDGDEIELWLVEGEAADGPTVVMLHGWGDGRLGQLLRMEQVRPAAGRVVLFDQRGHGESPHPCCDWGATERADAAAIIAHLRQEGEHGPIVLWGESLGAVVAIDVAANDADIAGVIADSPYRYASEPVRHYLEGRRLPTFALLPLVRMGMRLACGRQWRELQDTARSAERMTQPLLVLHGGADRVAAIAGARAIAEAAPAGRLEVFDDADHLEAAELEPARYRDVLAAWLTANVPNT